MKYTSQQLTPKEAFALIGFFIALAVPIVSGCKTDRSADAATNSVDWFSPKDNNWKGVPYAVGYRLRIEQEEGMVAKMAQMLISIKKNNEALSGVLERAKGYEAHTKELERQNRRLKRAQRECMKSLDEYLKVHKMYLESQKSER